MVTATAAPPLPPNPYTANRRGWHSRLDAWRHRRVDEEVFQADLAAHEGLQPRIEAVTVTPDRGFSFRSQLRLNKLAPKVMDRAEAYFMSGKESDRRRYYKSLKRLDRVLESGKRESWVSSRDQIISTVGGTATALGLAVVNSRREVLKERAKAQAAQQAAGTAPAGGSTINM